MTAVLYTPHFIQFFDDGGRPLAGGFLYTYEAGTTTPKATYSDNSGATPLSNPVELDAAGRARIFIDGSYKFVLHDSDNVAVANGTTDNVTSFSNTLDSGEPGDNTVTTVKIVDEAVTPAKMSETFYSLYKDRVLSGMTLSNSATDATNDIDIGSGSCVSDDGTAVMTLSSNYTKQLDAVWTVGTNQGGLDTGSIANTTYHVWVICRTDLSGGDVTDILFSASASSPTMPSGYTKKKCIGSIIRASSAILGFYQNKDEFYLNTPQAVYDAGASAGTAALTATLTGIPTGARLKVFANLTIVDNANYVYLSSLDNADVAPSTSVSPLSSGGVGSGATLTGQVAIWTNASAQIRARQSTNSAGGFKIAALGWKDTRI